jgi:hypothetical protein
MLERRELLARYPKLTFEISAKWLQQNQTALKRKTCQLMNDYIPKVLKICLFSEVTKRTRKVKFFQTFIALSFKKSLRNYI